MDERPKRRYYKHNLFQQLRGFYHVAVSRSFSAAAERMSIEQPSVTLQVQALERELETRLFDRGRREIALTPEGEMLFDLAAPLVEGLESLHEVFSQRLREFGGGRVVCATSESIVLLLLARVVQSFKVSSPNVDLVLRSGPSHWALDMLLRGEANVCIARVDHLPSNVVYEHLASFRNYVVVCKEHPLASRSSVKLEDAACFPVVAPLLEGTIWRALHATLEARRLPFQVATRLPSIEARLRCVELGMGITFEIGAGLACEVAPKLRWVPLAEDLPETTYGLMTLRNAFLPPAAKRFAQFLLDARGGLQAAEGLARGEAPAAG